MAKERKRKISPETGIPKPEITESEQKAENTQSSQEGGISYEAFAEGFMQHNEAFEDFRKSMRAALTQPEPTKAVEPTWKLDKGSGILHIECAGYESYVHVYVNGIRHKEAIKLDGGRKSIQLFGPTLPRNDLFIRVVKLKK